MMAMKLRTIIIDFPNIETCTFVLPQLFLARHSDTPRLLPVLLEHHHSSARAMEPCGSFRLLFFRLDHGIQRLR